MFSREFQHAQSGTHFNPEWKVLAGVGPLDTFGACLGSPVPLGRLLAFQDAPQTLLDRFWGGWGKWLANFYAQLEVSFNVFARFLAYAIWYPFQSWV